MKEKLENVIAPEHKPFFSIFRLPCVMWHETDKHISTFVIVMPYSICLFVNGLKDIYVLTFWKELTNHLVSAGVKNFL